ncbi:TonB-dependent receptor [Vandammella animalimorsus]|uniref:TonB-dependent receptor n=1 Tax=Vandammella animalimorsus TaxID=2029117 RepID=UPI0015569FD0|nr:TonB-dependent siderophore receptor [Vandammella animalimorsus]
MEDVPAAAPKAEELPAVEITGSSAVPQADTQAYVRPQRASVSRADIDAKDTPFTIETVDMQANREHGYQDLGQMLEGVAGVDAGYGAWYDSILIRGFDADMGDIYRDGIRTGGNFRRSTSNVERIEILKGPASVLYGRSQGGGVVNMVSKKASFDAHSSASLRAGSWGRRGAALDFNRVIGEQLAVRLNADFDRGHSFRPLIKNRNKLLSPSVLWRSTDRRLQWEGQYTWENRWYVPDRGPVKNEYDAMGLRFNYGFARPGDYIDNTMRMASSKLQYQMLPDWRLEWTLGWLAQHHDFDHFYLGSYNAASGLFNPNYSWVDQTQRTLSNSLALHGQFKTGPLRHRLMLGYDFTDERNEGDSGALLFSTRFGVNPHDRAGWPANTHRLVPGGGHSQYSSRAHALLFNDVIELTPALKLALGGRYDRYDYGFRLSRYGAHDFEGSSFSPSAGLVWTPHPDHNLYASWSRSFSPLGGNGYLLTLRSNPAKLDSEPQYNKQIEVGIKSEWLDRRLSSTLAFYQLSKHNIRYQPDPVNDPDRYEVAGLHRTRGIDFSLTGQINAHWHVRASLGLMSPKIVQDAGNPKREGRYLSGASRRQAGLAVRYVAPASQWFAELSSAHTGKRYPNPPASYDTAIAGYTRFDALLGWRIAPDLQAVFAVQNLADKQYWRNSHMPGEPRSFMVRVNYEF